jgi:hypothetical protein
MTDPSPPPPPPTTTNAFPEMLLDAEAALQVQEQAAQGSTQAIDNADVVDDDDMVDADADDENEDDNQDNDDDDSPANDDGAESNPSDVHQQTAAVGDATSDLQILHQNQQPPPSPAATAGPNFITQLGSPSPIKTAPNKAGIPSPQVQATNTHNFNNNLQMPPPSVAAAITHNHVPPQLDYLLIPTSELTCPDTTPLYDIMRRELQSAGYSIDPTIISHYVELILLSSNLWDEKKNVLRMPHLNNDFFTLLDPLYTNNFNLNSEKKKKAKKSAGGGGGGDGHDGGGDDDDSDHDDDDEWDVDWIDEEEEKDPAVDGDVADGCDLDQMDQISEAIMRQKQAYIQVSTALKAVKFVLHMHTRYISEVKAHHVALRKEAMTLQGLLQQRTIRKAVPAVSLNLLYYLHFTLVCCSQHTTVLPT